MKLKKEKALEREPYRSILRVFQFCYFKVDKGGKFREYWLRFGHLYYLLKTSPETFPRKTRHDKHFFADFSKTRFWRGGIEELERLFKVEIPPFLSYTKKYIRKEKLDSILPPITKTIKRRERLADELRYLAKIGWIEERREGTTKMRRYRLSNQFWEDWREIRKEKDLARKKKDFANILKAKDNPSINIYNIYGFSSDEFSFIAESSFSRLLGFSLADLELMTDKEKKDLEQAVHLLSAADDSLLRLKKKITQRLEKEKKYEDALRVLSSGVGHLTYYLF